MKVKQLILIIPLLIISILTLAHGNQESDYHFTENKGQLNQKVKYHCKFHLGDIYFQDNQFTFDLFSAEELSDLYQHTNHHDSHNGTVGDRKSVV